MIKIKDFITNKLSITWTLLDIGFYGSEKFNKQLAAEDIIDYAIAKMEEDAKSHEILLLASLQAGDVEEINYLLKKLSGSETVHRDVEYKKWVLMYVVKHLPNEQDDYIQGLIELGDIWATLDYPDNSPHIFQGGNNLVTPRDYYTQVNYNCLLARHKEWILNELAQINK